MDEVSARERTQTIRSNEVDDPESIREKTSQLCVDVSGLLYIVLFTFPITALFLSAVDLPDE